MRLFQAVLYCIQLTLAYWLSMFCPQQEQKLFSADRDDLQCLSDCSRHVMILIFNNGRLDVYLFGYQSKF